MPRWTRIFLSAAAFALVLLAAVAWTGDAPPVLVSGVSAGCAVALLVALQTSRDRRLRADNVIRAAAAQPGRALMEAVRTSGGESLMEFSSRNPVLLVFVRHSGCCFCREALSDLASERSNLERAGIRIAIVCLGREQGVRRLLRRYRLNGVELIRDTRGSLYRAFGLRRGTVSQLLGPEVWLRGFEAAFVERHGLGLPDANPWQMPGLFLVHEGRLLARYYHRSAADRPNYSELCQTGLQVNAESRLSRAGS